MPLTASVDATEVHAFDLDRDRWEDLRQQVNAGAVVAVLGCGRQATLRVSSQGVQHFVHRRDATPCSSGHAPMTLQHAMLQQRIIEAARAVGWSAADEVPGRGWRADVLATSGDSRMAFEVQWSQQTLSEYRRRQHAYLESGVRAAWFARAPSFHPRALGGFPLFRIERVGEAWVVQVGALRVSIDDAVAGLLQEHWQHRGMLRARRRSRVAVLVDKCGSCRRGLVLWRALEQRSQSVCGMESRWERDERHISSLWVVGDRDVDPVLVRAARERASSTAPLAIVSSDHGLVDDERVFVCPWCTAVQTDLSERFRSASPSSISEEWTPVVEISQQHPHWCDTSLEGC